VVMEWDGDLGSSTVVMLEWQQLGDLLACD
jgi:hypothetical protein